MNLKAVLEGLLFVVGDDGLTVEQIKDILKLDIEAAKQLLLELKQSYENDDRGIRINYLGNTFKLTTKEEHKEYYQRLITEANNYSLSQAALEILAIIVYNEPTTRVQVDQLRGVNSGQMIRKLVAKGLVKEVGRSDAPGRPILYKTTNEFLDYFGLASKEDLPSFEEITAKQEEIDLYTSSYQEKE
jgi:segregation and condensation protein B